MDVCFMKNNVHAWLNDYIPSCCWLLFFRYCCCAFAPSVSIYRMDNSPAREKAGEQWTMDNEIIYKFSAKWFMNSHHIVTQRVHMHKGQWLSKECNVCCMYDTLYVTQIMEHCVQIYNMYMDDRMSDVHAMNKMSSNIEHTKKKMETNWYIGRDKERNQRKNEWIPMIKILNACRLMCHGSHSWTMSHEHWTWVYGVWWWPVFTKHQNTYWIELKCELWAHIE